MSLLAFAACAPSADVTTGANALADPAPFAVLLTADLPAAGLAAQLDRDGTTLGDLRLRFTAWGPDGAVSGVQPADPTRSACPDGVPLSTPCVVQDHGDVIAWWAPRAAGVELGWTVPYPAGDHLTFLVALDGAAQLSPATDGAVLRTASGRAWTLSGLLAWDATGAALPSALAVEGAHLRVTVDATGARFPVTVDPLLEAASWVATGKEKHEHLGYSIASAGDVDGDGYDDVLVGSRAYDASGTTDEGKVALYRGSPTGPGMTADWTFVGDADEQNLGCVVAPAGDVDGDGYDDVVVGGTGDSTRRGIAAVFLGSATGLGASPAWFVKGEAEDEWLGRSVAGAGDVDGDGYDDVIVGADGAPPSEAGLARVYLGSAHGLGATPAWEAIGEASSDHFGRAVAGAGDVDGDGYADILVGAPGVDDGALADVGRAYLYAGSAAGPTSAWTVTGDTAHEEAGGALAGAGDVDGDHFDDVLVGSPRYDSPSQGDETGRARLYRGSATGLAAGPSWSVQGEGSGDAYGSAVATAGDVDADGFADVLVGAPAYSGGGLLQGGRAYLYLGSPRGLAPADAWTATAPGDLDALGSSVAGAGDVNGDGYADGLVGAPDADEVSLTNSGRVYLHLGWGDIDRDGSPAGGDGTLGDCDDTNPLVHPGATEVCDPTDVDEDCDGLADDNDPDVDHGTWSTWLLDADGDGYGDDTATTRACAPPDGHVATGGDCDDADADVHPGAQEVCEGSGGRGADEDCDGPADDADPSLDAATTSPWHPDADADGFGDPASTTTACVPPAGWTADATDCNDHDPAVNPAAPEVVGNPTDEDCDGLVASLADTDGPPVDTGCGCATPPRGALPLVPAALLAVSALRRRRRG